MFFMSHFAFDDIQSLLANLVCRFAAFRIGDPHGNDIRACLFAAGLSGAKRILEHPDIVGHGFWNRARPESGTEKQQSIKHIPASGAQAPASLCQ